MSTFCPEVVRWLVLITKKAKKCKMAICAATQDLSLLFNSLLVKYAIVHVCAQSASRVWLIETPWTVAYQVPLSMGFYRQEYWSGLPCSPPGDLPNPGIEPASPESPALSGRFFYHWATWEAQVCCCLQPKACLIGIFIIFAFQTST